MGSGAIVRGIAALSVAAWLSALGSAAAAPPSFAEIQLPPATIENTIPPNLSRTYFEGAVARPFPASGAAFSWTRAWWLAEAALLSYAEEEFAKRQFAAAGLKVERFSNGSTQAYIAFNDSFVILALRGTQIPKIGSTGEVAAAFAASLADIVTDAKILPAMAKPAGMAHKGFVEGWAAVSTDVLKRIRDLKTEKPARSVWFTGHSLGGALAILGAAEYGAADGLYTFGAPPVGDKAFTDRLTCPAFRFVNNNDAVPNVPIPYRHAGQLRYFDRTGEPAATPPLPTRVVDGIKDWFGAFSGALTSNGSLIFPRSPLTDHAPLYYALLVRHALDTQRQH